MPNSPTFAGFEKPTENFYRLPNDWFSRIIDILRKYFGDRIVGLIKTLEYILCHTWGYQNWDGQIRLSANEIRNGKRGNNTDSGTGLSENTINNAGKVLQKLGIINIDQDTKDKARRLKTYSPNIVKSISTETVSEFEGFVPPTSNYFIVPKIWITLMREITSAATIIVVEYSFRHAWGYDNPEGTWMTADEYVNGRKYKTSDSRYDKGTGYKEATIYRALNDAVKRGLLVFAERDDDSYKHRVYNLRFPHMQVNQENGQCISPLPWEDNVISGQDSLTNEVASGTVEVEKALTVEAASPAIEVVSCTDEAANRTNEARSLKDTPLDTSHNTPQKTPSSRISKKRRSSHTDVVVELPQSILDNLADIDWADTTQEIQSAYTKSPELVHAWLEFVIAKKARKYRAGAFRKGIRSGEMPPYKAQKLGSQYHISTDLEDDNDIPAAQEQPDYTTNPDVDPKINNAWQSVLTQLSTEMSPGAYNSYVKQTYVLAYHDGVMQIASTNQEQQAWLDDRIKSSAHRLLIGILGHTVDVQFICPGSTS